MYALSAGGRGRIATWVDGPVALGRLVDHASSFERPGAVIASAGAVHIVADARIDNGTALDSELGLRTPEDGQRRHEERILGAYRRWGDVCLEHLDGDFAFALWDPARRCLFCGRDRFGLRPLYYSVAGSSIAVASDIRALLALPWVNREIDRARIADFLMHVDEDSGSTFYSSIRRLPPAHGLTADIDGPKLRIYWRLDPRREIELGSDEEYAEAFRERFVDAVRARLGNEGKVACMLSGGLDSTSITCVARALLEGGRAEALDTYSLVFDDVPKSDERRHIEPVLQRGGFSPQYVRGDRVHQFRALDRMLFHLAEPFTTSNLFLYWQLYHQASSRGVTAMLDGLLGDDIVGHGDRYLTRLAATGHWLRLVREIIAVRDASGISRRKLVRDYVVGPLIVEPIRRIGWAAGWRRRDVGSGGRFVRRELLRETNAVQRAQQLRHRAARTPLDVRQEQVRNLSSGALPAAMEALHKTGAAFGITPSLPFADRRLVEFCLAVPDLQKYRAGWTRVILRRALEEYLPEHTRNRYGKTYLHHGFNHSLLKLGGAELESFVFDRVGIADAFVDTEALQECYRSVTAGRAEAASLDSVLQSMWRAVLLTRWFELERSGALRAPPAPSERKNHL